MFSIGIRFLMGRYYAQDPAYTAQRSKPTPEWPPAPDRLFSALVAAAYTNSKKLPADEAAALRWFEQLPPPSWSGTIHSSSETRNGRVILTAVPKNYEVKKELHQNALRYATSIASESPGYWTWSDVDPTKHLVALTHLIHRVSYLGSSASFVSLWIESNPPEPTLVPASDQSIDHMVRLPYPGRLTFLQTTYQQINTYPSPGLPQGYQLVQAIQPPTITPRIDEGPYDQLYVWTLDPAMPRSIASGLQVTNRLRQAVIAQAKILQQPIPKAISGHLSDCDMISDDNRSPHCAYLALPHVYSPHSDGHIVALAVAIPRTLSAEDQHAVYQFLGTVKALQVGNTSYQLIPRSHRSPYAADPRRWSKPATQWTSVSPVVFDQFPTTRKPLLTILNLMAEHAKLPEIIACQTIQPNGAVPMARDFFIKRHSNSPAALVRHLTIAFAHPVKGPILLGRLRHFGLGLFVPQEGGSPIHDTSRVS